MRRLLIGILLIICAAVPARAQQLFSGRMGGRQAISLNVCFGSACPNTCNITTPTNITTCGQAIGAGNWRLASNLGCSAGGLLASVTAAGAKIDVQVDNTGIIQADNISDIGNIEVCSSTDSLVTCDSSSEDVASTSNGYCIELVQASDAVTSAGPVLVHHIRVRNTRTTGGGNVGEITIEKGSGTSPRRVVSYVTVSNDGSSGARNPLVRFTGPFPADFHHSQVDCTTNSNACGMVFQYAPNLNRAYWNSFKLSTSAIDTARAVFCDISSHNCWAYRNFFDVGVNRAFETRGSESSHFIANWMSNIHDSQDGFGAFELAGCVSDAPSDFSNNAVVRSNTLEFTGTGGKPGEIQDSDGHEIGPNFYWLNGATATDSWRIRVVSNNCGGTLGPAPAATFRNNAPSILSLTSPHVSCLTGTTCTMCKSGTASGAGTIVNDNGIC